MKMKLCLETAIASGTHGRDVHMWVRKDGDGPPLTLECIPGAEEATTKVQQLLESGKIATVVGLTSPIHLACGLYAK